MINKSLYLSQYLLKSKENESRIKWNVGDIIINYIDYKNDKWVKGTIINIFDKEEGKIIIVFDNKKNTQRFDKLIGTFIKTILKIIILFNQLYVYIHYIIIYM